MTQYVLHVDGQQDECAEQCQEADQDQADRDGELGRAEHA